MEFFLLYLHIYPVSFSELHLTRGLILAQFQVIQTQRPFFLEICPEQFNTAHVKIEVAPVPLQTSSAELDTHLKTIAKT